MNGVLGFSPSATVADTQPFVWVEKRHLARNHSSFKHLIRKTIQKKKYETPVIQGRKSADWNGMLGFSPSAMGADKEPFVWDEQHHFVRNHWYLKQSDSKTIQKKKDENWVIKRRLFADSNGVGSFSPPGIVADIQLLVWDKKNTISQEITPEKLFETRVIQEWNPVDLYGVLGFFHPLQLLKNSRLFGTKTADSCKIARL